MIAFLICVFAKNVVKEQEEIAKEYLNEIDLNDTFNDFFNSALKSQGKVHGLIGAFSNQQGNLQIVPTNIPNVTCYMANPQPPNQACVGQTDPQQIQQQQQAQIQQQQQQAQIQQQQQQAQIQQQQQQQQQAQFQQQQQYQMQQKQPQPQNQPPVVQKQTPAQHQTQWDSQSNSKPVIICPEKTDTKKNVPKDVLTPDFGLSRGAVKKITTVTVTKADTKSPLQKVKEIDPELGKQIEKIFDFNGIIEPWSAYEDLSSPKAHQMPDSCNMVRKVKAMLKVFENLKELISKQFVDIEKFVNRGKQYLKEYANEMKINLDSMILYLRKMKAAKDYSTKDEYMKKFNSVHCHTQEIIGQYKKLRSWLINTIKAFSSMFHPFNVNRFV